MDEIYSKKYLEKQIIDSLGEIYKLYLEREKHVQIVDKRKRYLRKYLIDLVSSKVFTEFSFWFWENILNNEMSNIDDFYFSNTVWLLVFSILCCLNYYDNNISDSEIKNAKDNIIHFNILINDELDKYFEILQDYFIYFRDIDYEDEIGKIFVRHSFYVREGIRNGKFDDSFSYNVVAREFTGIINNFVIGNYVKNNDENVKQRKL